MPTAAALSFSWACLNDRPPGALPSGSGALCYTEYQLCMEGPNGCAATGTPCVAGHPLCLTGLAGGTNKTETPTDQFPDAALPHAWLCLLDIPTSAVVNGMGSYCYSSAQACSEGAFAALHPAPPCSPFLVHHQHTALKRPPTPHSTATHPTGPNSCNDARPCSLDMSACSTGPASNMRSIPGSPTYGFYCAGDDPKDAYQNGAGA